MKRMLAIALVLGMASMAMGASLSYTLEYTAAYVDLVNYTEVADAVVPTGDVFAKGPNWDANLFLAFSVCVSFTPDDAAQDLQSIKFDVFGSGGIVMAGEYVGDIGAAVKKGMLTKSVFGAGNSDTGSSTTDYVDIQAMIDPAWVAWKAQVGETGPAYVGEVYIHWDGTPGTLTVASSAGTNCGVWNNNATGTQTVVTDMRIITSTAIPEPVTMVLLGLGSLVLRRRR